MQEHAASRTAARIAAAAGAVFAIVGLILVFGAYPGGSRLTGIGTAFQTVIGGVLLVAAGVIGLVAVIFWLIALRRTRRHRQANRILL